MTSKYHNAGNRGRLTTARYENPIPKDDGVKPRYGFGAQGRGVCPHCGIEVTLRLANTEYRSPDIPYDTIVCANHVIGGGKKKRGVYYCPGSGQEPA